MDHSACPSCNLPVLSVFYFCPNCAKSLRPKPLSTSIGNQIGIYLLSALVPPFGLVPGIKYLLQKSGKAKAVGAVAVLLTIISIALTVQFATNVINQFNQQLNSQLQINQLF
ncbi:MAG TPA: hypothetical protein VNA13_01025 [Xanthomonadales bacterium]|nr:hypothetical protein [Xanthomonadales bacterium]